LQKAGNSTDASLDNMVIDRYGRFLYVSGENETIVNGGLTQTFAIYGFTISPTDGSLTAISGSPFIADLNGPIGLIIDHSDTYLYATDEGNSTISAYTIDQTTGALSPLSTLNTSPNSPYQLALDPSGTHLYVSSGATTISAFSIGTGGILTPVGPDLVVHGPPGYQTNIYSPVVDPSGTHIYMAGLWESSCPWPCGYHPPPIGMVYGFSIGSHGVIGSAISGTPIAASTGGDIGDSMVIDPTGTLLAIAKSLNDTILLYTIGPGGALTAVTPVPVTPVPIAEGLLGVLALYNAP
jgi:6-phosphogluconolactonase (cycloisomerase 2 family)